MATDRKSSFSHDTRNVQFARVGVVQYKQYKNEEPPIFCVDDGGGDDDVDGGDSDSKLQWSWQDNEVAIQIRLFVFAFVEFTPVFTLDIYQKCCVA